MYTKKMKIDLKNYCLTLSMSTLHTSDIILKNVNSYYSYFIK